MRGAVVKRGKTYSFVLPLERDPETGRKRQKWVGGFTTKKACEAALGEALGRVQAGTFAADSGRMTVAVYAQDWLAAVEPTVRPSTFTSYRSVMDNYVVPRLGTVRLSTLTPAQLGRLYTELGASGGKTGGPLSPTTVRYAHTVLGKALQDAVGWGLVARNVARTAKPPRKASTVMQVWSSGSPTAVRRDSCSGFGLRPRLLVTSVAKVHQLPNRVVLVGLDQLATAIPGDLDVTDKAEVGAVEVRQLGRDAFDALDAVDHAVDR